METGLPRPILPIPNIGETRPIMDRTGMPGPPPAEIMPLPQNSFQRSDMTAELLRDPRPLSPDAGERIRREVRKAADPKAPSEKEEAAYQLELGAKKAQNEALETILAYERLGRRLSPARSLRPYPIQTPENAPASPAPDTKGEKGSIRPGLPGDLPPEEGSLPPQQGRPAPAEGLTPPGAPPDLVPARPGPGHTPVRPPQAALETDPGAAPSAGPADWPDRVPPAPAPERTETEAPAAFVEPRPARPAFNPPEGAAQVAFSVPEPGGRRAKLERAAGADSEAAPERGLESPRFGVRRAPAGPAEASARAVRSPAAGEARGAPENLRKLSQMPYWLYLFGGEVPRYADEEEARALPSRRARRSQPEWTGENLTLAEAVRLAAVLHNVYYGGDGAFERDTPWYRPFVAYALAHGIIKDGEFEEPEAPVTRGFFAEILARCVPDAALPALNPLAVVPDVREGEGWGDSALKMVRAGVFAPVGPLGLFDPERLVTRREASVYVGRVITPSDRRRF